MEGIPQNYRKAGFNVASGLQRRIENVISTRSPMKTVHSVPHNCRMKGMPRSRLVCAFVALIFSLSYRSLRGKVLEEHMRTISQVVLDPIRVISLFVHAQRLYITSNDRIVFVSFSCLDKSVLLGATCSLVSIWCVFAPVVRIQSPTISRPCGSHRGWLGRATWMDDPSLGEGDTRPRVRYRVIELVDPSSIMATPEERRLLTKSLVRLTLLLVLVGTAIALTGVLHGLRHPEDWLQWFEDNPKEGAGVFILGYTISTVLLVPGVIFNLFAGMAFSLLWGSFCTWVGTVLGQTLAFLTARYLLRELVVSLTSERYRAWSAVDEAISRESWKVVSLLRLSIVMPYNFLNYMLGASSVGFVPYTVASALGVIPSTILFVYIGSITRDIGRVLSGDVPVAGPLGLFVGIVGVAILLGVAWHIARITKSAISDVMGKDLDHVLEEERGDEGGLEEEGVALTTIS